MVMLRTCSFYWRGRGALMDVVGAVRYAGTGRWVCRFVVLLGDGCGCGEVFVRIVCRL